MSFKRGLAWTAGGQAAFFGIQLAGSVILARLLDPYAFGVFALASAVTAVLSLIQQIGMSAYLVREVDLTPQKLHTAFTISAILSALICISIIAVANMGERFSLPSAVSGVLYILSVTPMLGLFTIVPSAILEREANFKALSLVNLVRSIFATAMTVGLVLAGYGVYGIAWGQVAAMLLSSILIIAVVRGRAAVRLSLRGWRPIASFGMQMLAVSGVNALAGRASDLLLARFLGISSLGLYGRASTTNNLFWENAHTVMGRVVFSEMARLKRENVSLRSFYLEASEIITVILWPVFAGLAIFSKPLIRIVYGEQWVAASLPFALLAVSSIVLISATMTWEIFVVSNEMRRQTKLEMIRVVTGTALFAVGCSISLAAAASARVIDALLAVLLYRPHLHRMTDTTLSDLLSIYARSGALTVLATAPALVLVASSEPGMVTVNLPRMIVTTLAGIGLWAVALVALRHPLYRHARAFQQRMTKP